MAIRYSRTGSKLTAQRCQDARHLPDRSNTTVDDGIKRARCRFCHCELVRMANGTRWRFCGELGAAAEVEDDAC